MAETVMDRNLVFGMLALQNGFISQPEMLLAMEACAREKPGGLDEVLVAQGRLTQPQSALLAALVTEHLQRHGSLEKSLASIPLTPAVREELSQIQDPQLQASLMQATIAAAPVQPAALPVPPATRLAATQAVRYRTIHLHAEGGLGKVFLAHDEELHRDVALKEIRPRLSGDQDSRARFIREAEITGGLEHPGIVPVYGLGQHPDGRPYYAMRFIQGTTLKDAIEKFHNTRLSGDTTHPGESQPQKTAAAKRTRSERNLDLRKLLTRLIAVCEAIEYAHSRGVLHRDLKPGNIMLGRYGETLVVDWGLARAGGEVEDDSSSNKEVALVPASGGSSATQFGSAVGTPSFMSPEQAAGRLDLLSPASDIYSLGATLYAVLTGHAPIEGKDVGKVLERVRAGDFPRPRSIQRKISPALEAICLKAMAKLPRDRYVSAREMAGDIEHWLADEPVSAHQESVGQRLSRWSRRNRGVVRAGACGLVLLAAVSIAAAALINNERLNVEHQRQTAETQRQRAQNLAIDNAKLASQERKQREAAVRLASDNERIAKEKTKLAEEMTVLAGQNAKLAEEQRQEADKSRRLAEFLVGTFQAADPIGLGGATFFIPKANSEQLTARQILDRGAERVQGDKQLDKFPLAKAAIMNEIGDVYRQLGLFPQAEPLLTEALQLRRDLLPKDHPDVAASCHSLGWYYHERGDYVRAEKLYGEAQAIREKLTNEEGQRLAAATMFNLAWMLANDRQPRQAERLFRQTLEIRRKLYGDQHREVIFCELGIAFALIEQGRFLEATPLVLAAKDKFVKLEGNQHLSEGATAFALGVIYRHTLGPRAAEGQLQLALQSVTAALGPDNIYVGLIHYELGWTLESLGKLDDAEVQYQHALRIAREQVQMQHPRIVIFVARYSRFLNRKGKPDEAGLLWDEFLRAQRNRFGDDNLILADALFLYGAYLREYRHYAAACKNLADAVAIYERQTETEYSFHEEAVKQLALAFLDEGKDFAAAERYIRRTIELQTGTKKAAGASGDIMQINLAAALLGQNNLDQAEEILLPIHDRARKHTGKEGAQCLEYALHTLARLHLAKREPAKAARFIAERKGFSENSPGDLYTIAGQFAQCAKLVGAGGGELSAAQQEERKKYIDQSLARLREAFAAGYKNVTYLRKDEAFSVLRDEPEFQKLVGDREGGGNE